MTQGLAIIGNCSYSALLKEGSVEWMCWPRPDSSFVFGPLLDRGLDDLRAFTRITCDLILAIRRCPRPVVAALNGTTAGAGAVIAIACSPTPHARPPDATCQRKSS